MSLVEKIKQFVSRNSDRLNQLYTGWENRPYDFYLIFGPNEESKSPWIKSNWEINFEPYFDLLLKQAGMARDTGIRATKYKPEKRISKKDNEEFIYFSEIKLGRLRWDTKSHEKWTILNSADHYFEDMELWTPIWTICERRDSPPDFYIKISNERDTENKRDIQFGYFIVVAIARDLKIDSKPILAELSEKIDSKATILKTRRWGTPENSGNWTFSNWIQDTFSNGIYKGGNLHSIDFNKLEFEPMWEVIHRQK